MAARRPRRPDKRVVVALVAVEAVSAALAYRDLVPKPPYSKDDERDLLLRGDAAFLDHVLPQTAHQGATRVIERQAKIREGRRRIRSRRRIRRCRGCWFGGRYRPGRVVRRSDNWRYLIAVMMVMRMARHVWFPMSTGQMVA